MSYEIKLVLTFNLDSFVCLHNTRLDDPIDDDPEYVESRSYLGGDDEYDDADEDADGEDFPEDGDHDDVNVASGSQ